MTDIPCAICGGRDTAEILKSSDTHLRVDTVEYSLVKCRNCGLVYINPQPNEEEVSKYYNSEYHPYLENYETLKASKLFEIVRGFKHFLKRGRSRDTTMPPSKNQASAADMSEKTVLDFGCGNGSFLLSLRQDHPHWKLFGFDISANRGIESLGRDITIYRGQLTDLVKNFKPRSADFIYLNNVLEHLNDPAGTLRTLSKFLKEKDGDMLIEVPNIDTWKFRVFGTNYASLDIPRHLYHFSPATLETLCWKSGLIVKNIRLSGSPKSTLRSLYFMFGVKEPQFNPFLYNGVRIMTNLLGKKKIDNDVIIAHLTTAPLTTIPTSSAAIRTI